MKQTMIQIGESNWISLTDVQFISYVAGFEETKIHGQVAHLEIQYETGVTVSLDGESAQEAYSKIKPILVNYQILYQ